MFHLVIKDENIELNKKRKDRSIMEKVLNTKFKWLSLSIFYLFIYTVVSYSF